MAELIDFFLPEEEIRNEFSVNEKPFFKLAAILIKFDLLQIRRLLLTIFNCSLSDENISDLLQKSEETIPEGFYTLNDSFRNEVLKQIDKEEVIEISKTVRNNSDITQRIFNTYLSGIPLDLNKLTLQELSAAYNVSKWLRQTKFETPSPDEVLNLITREEFIDPFRKLTVNFQGRKSYLNDLSDYVNWLPPSNTLHKLHDLIRNVISWHDKPPIMITGIGGIGKSTLIAKFILDHLSTENKLPFIYFDFDRPGLSSVDPVILGLEALKQLAYQFPNNKEVYESICVQLRETYLNENFSNKSRSSDRLFFYHKHLQIFQEQINKIKTPILVVFDSFEEVQFKAKSHELTNLFQFLEEISNLLPRLRTVFVGRSELSNIKLDKIITIGEFDLEASNAYLKSQIDLPDETAANIFKKVGGNPLTLRLAVDLIKKTNSIELKPTPENIETLFKSINKARIQEQLVKRNLDHINDDRVRKLAVPGMLLRKINPHIIRYILAEPCGLGTINETEAKEIYDSLTRETFLISNIGESAYFRQDLRLALNNLIVESGNYNVKGVYDYAITYYKNKYESKNNLKNEDIAELIYYILKRDTEPNLVDKYFIGDIWQYIVNSLPEFTVDQQIHLLNLQKITAPSELLNSTNIFYWEEYFEIQISEALVNGNDINLSQLDKLLRTRKERTGNMKLDFCEQKLKLRLGILKEIKLKTFTNIKIIQSLQLKYHLLYAKLFEYQYDFIKCSSALFQAELLILKNNMVDINQFDSGDIIDWIIMSSRITIRTGKNAELVKYSMNSEKLSYLLDDQSSIYNLFPKPYNIFVKTIAKNNPKLSLFQLIEEISGHFCNFKLFNKLLEEINVKTKGIDDLEFLIRMRIENSPLPFDNKIDLFNLHLKDICEPGDYKILVQDIAFFIELFFISSNNEESQNLN